MDDKSCRRCQSDTLSPYFLFISLFTRWTRYRGRGDFFFLSPLSHLLCRSPSTRVSNRITVDPAVAYAHSIRLANTRVLACPCVCVGNGKFFFCLLLFIPIDDISRLGSHSTSNIIGFRCCIVYTVYPITGELDEKLGEKGESPLVVAGK